jgi:hypothetical protein
LLPVRLRFWTGQRRKKNCGSALNEGSDSPFRFRRSRSRQSFLRPSGTRHWCSVSSIVAVTQPGFAGRSKKVLDRSQKLLANRLLIPTSLRNWTLAAVGRGVLDEPRRARRSRPTKVQMQKAIGVTPRLDCFY